jgi:hypothetical protein
MRFPSPTIVNYSPVVKTVPGRRKSTAIGITLRPAGTYANIRCIWHVKTAVKTVSKRKELVIRRAPEPKIPITILNPAHYPSKLIMKAFLRFVTVAASLTLSAYAADDASELKVQASSDLRVAILDTTRSGNDRTSVHEAFAASLSAAMSKECGGTVNVKVTEVDAFRLSFDLKAGMYDAAFVVGSNVPAVLKKGDYEILRAVSDVGAPGRVFHMIVPTEDAGLQKMIVASFPQALSAPKFQEAVTRAFAVKINADAIKKAVDQSVADTTR